MNNTNFPYPASIQGHQLLFSGCSQSENVQLETGNLIRKLALISVPTLGPPLEIRLLYHSRVVDEDKGFGFGWKCSWGARLSYADGAAVFIDENGAELSFVYADGEWKLNLEESIFQKVRLTTSPQGARIEFYPDQGFLDFDETGRLIAKSDSSGNAVVANYTGEHLTSIVEQALGVSAGRTITLNYSVPDQIAITDPRGGQYLLQFDSERNLTQVVGPEGCVTSFEYADPTDHWITRRIDPVPRDPREFPLHDQAWSYEFDADGRLLKVVDSRGKEIRYAYIAHDAPGAWSERYTDGEERLLCSSTVLTDADDGIWRYIFDRTGNMRRMIDPNMHQRRFFWSDESLLLYEAAGPTNIDSTAGYATELGPRDHFGMRFRRNVYNTRGNLLQSFDGNGRGVFMEYEEDRLVAVSPGRMNYAVQGDWQGHYGTEGALLCGAAGNADVALALPAYLQAVQPGTPAPLRFDYTSSSNYRMDSRTLRYPSAEGMRWASGMWKSTAGQTRFCFSLDLAEDARFNLSFYFCFVHRAQGARYSENFGQDLEVLVSDAHGQQRCRVMNVAGGAWVTFAVEGEAHQTIEVEVCCRGGVSPEDEPAGEALLSAIAFDPFEERTARMAYNNVGLPTSYRDPLGHETVYEYNLDGSLAKVRDALLRETLFFYEDDYKNLTRVVDAEEGEIQLEYDLNGNVITIEDADGKRTEMEYDGKDRLVLVTDPLGHQNRFDFDPAGRPIRVLGELGRSSRFEYLHGRLARVVDALGQVSELSYGDRGQVSGLVDARGKVTEFDYDQAGQLTEVTSADQAVWRFAYDSLGRLAGFTGANANQQDTNDILLRGAKNVIFNPEAEMVMPDHPLLAAEPAQAQVPRYWQGLNSSGGAVDGRRAEEDGRHHFPLNSDGVKGWVQYDLPAGAGGRYAARMVARNQSGSPVSLTMSMVHRLHKGFPEHISWGPAQETPGFTPGSDWEASTPYVMDIPGDIQATNVNPAVRSLQVSVESGAQPVSLRSVELLRLSTHFEYDGENLREVTGPDGARQRVEHDRLGRPQVWMAADGTWVQCVYDSLDRPIRLLDSEGVEQRYEFDAVGNLSSFRLVFRDSVQTTLFEYDDLDRLHQLIYADGSYEQFDYSPAGDLIGYRDNRGQQFSFVYDDAHRLIEMTYPDTSAVSWTYDAADRVLSRVERGGERYEYLWDRLDRLKECRHFDSEDELLSRLRYVYNQLGQLQRVLGQGAYYGEGRYGQSRFGGVPMWIVPDGDAGRDSMGRLLAVDDAEQQRTTSTYDVEGRRLSWSRPNDTSDRFGYDIVGKLMNVRFLTGQQEHMSIGYGYSLNRDRLAQVTDRDCYSYALDRSGRLIEETHNRFCLGLEQSWKQGEWDRTGWDSQASCLRLVDFDDDFSGYELDAARWKLTTHHHTDGSDPVSWSEYQGAGLEIRQQDGLAITYPRGVISTAFLHSAPVHDQIGSDIVGYHLTKDVNRPGRPIYTQLQHRIPLAQDFDIAVDYDLNDWNALSLGIRLAPTSPTHTADPYPYLSMGSGGVDASWVQDHQPVSLIGSAGSVPRGTLRIRRDAGTLTFYYRSRGQQAWQGGWTVEYAQPDLKVFLTSTSTYGVGSVVFRNFRSLLPEIPLAVLGSFTSGIYDAGFSTVWERLSWEEECPSGTNIQWEMAVGDSVEDFRSPIFFGPSGPGSFFTTAAGELVPSGSQYQGRYAMVRATLTSSVAGVSPRLRNFQLSFNPGSGVGSRAIRYSYDQPGNLVSRLTLDHSGRSLDRRDSRGWPADLRVNELNQVMTRDVDGDLTQFVYDLNGNLTQRISSAASWTYVWDADNRLIQVRRTTTDGARFDEDRYDESTYLSGGDPVEELVVDYTYDSQGRLQTRSDSTSITRWTWSGWDCLAETSNGVTTTFLVPEGQMLSFHRAGQTYQVHADALGSVRLVTDQDGEVVARFEYGAWGDLLGGSFDDVGCPYRFVGSLGCRTDFDTGLVYMRHRWYDPGLQRFISRDPIGLMGGANLYAYPVNPLRFIDPSGLNDTILQVGNAAPVVLGAIGRAVVVDTVTFTTGETVGTVALSGLGGPLLLTLGLGLTIWAFAPPGFGRYCDEYSCVPFDAQEWLNEHQKPKECPEDSCPSKRLALGLQSVVLSDGTTFAELEFFAESMNAHHLGGRPEWQKKFESEFQDPSITVLFNLTGVDVEQGIAKAKLAELTKKKCGGTNFELYYISKHQDRPVFFYKKMPHPLPLYYPTTRPEALR